MQQVMELLPLIIGGTVFVALLILIWVGFQTAETKISGKQSLKAIESYSWQGDSIVAKEASFFDRVVVSSAEKMSSIGLKFTPIGYVDTTKKKLQYAGRRGADEVDRFLAMRVLTVAVAGVFALIALSCMVAGKTMLGMMFLILGVVAGIGPDAILSRQVGDRQKKIRRSLPDVLDLLTISVEAGLGFEQALDRISDAVPGPLTDEFVRMSGEMRAGSSRAEALQGVEARTGVEEVKSFVMSMVQADQFGVSIGRVLRAQADEMRIKRRQIAQEAAQKAPVKMLLPMTFFIFPALFVVVLGPAMLNIMANFK